MLAYLALASKVHAAKTSAELSFIICNDSRALVSYRQGALVALGKGKRRTRLVGHSGLADVDANSPYAVWLADVVEHVRGKFDALPPAARVLSVSPSSLPQDLAEQWGDWLPAQVWAIGLAGPDGHVTAVLLLARDEPWPVEVKSGTPEFLLLQAAGLYGYAWWALTTRTSKFARVWKQLTSSRRVRIVAAVVVALMFVPVREYALVPAEIVSTHTEVIASPRDGVIKRMVVRPNTPVAAGQTIAEMDDLTLDNQLAVAQATLATARTELHQAAQQAIESQTAKADLGLAEGKVQENEVNVQSIRSEIDRLAIKAPRAGVFIYSDPDDWAGKPVQTGERVGLLADPGALGIHAWAPVNEAVNLHSGAAMKMFLRVAPLHPVAARLDYAGYQAVEAPDGVASYLLRGTLDKSNDEDARSLRIGLRGTARVTGDWSMLGYLIFRRPIASAREWLGW